MGRARVVPVGAEAGRVARHLGHVLAVQLQERGAHLLAVRLALLVRAQQLAAALEQVRQAYKATKDSILFAFLLILFFFIIIFLLAYVFTLILNSVILFLFLYFFFFFIKVFFLSIFLKFINKLISLGLYADCATRLTSKSQINNNQINFILFQIVSFYTYVTLRDTRDMRV